MNNAYECTVVTRDDDRIVVRGAERVRVSKKGELELFTQSIVSKDVVDSWLWGLYRTTRVVTDINPKQTSAVFARGMWKACWVNGTVVRLNGFKVDGVKSPAGESHDVLS